MEANALDAAEHAEAEAEQRGEGYLFGDFFPPLTYGGIINFTDYYFNFHCFKVNGTTYLCFMDVGCGGDSLWLYLSVLCCYCALAEFIVDLYNYLLLILRVGTLLCAKRCWSSTNP